MELFQLEQASDTPYVLLDPTNNKFIFKGKSLPEDVDEFYNPIELWLGEYMKTPGDHLTVIFKMDYFNTASLKKIINILHIFRGLQENGVKVEIKWNYRKDDDCMKESGEEIQEMVEMEFEHISL